jgi:alpha-ketoglutaric semialdehyde dehydrogenase
MINGAILVGAGERQADAKFSAVEPATGARRQPAFSDADQPLAARILPALQRACGRVLANGWPTGVEVTHAMVHGGPFPATSDGRSTSVGTLAMSRFLRPVCYQDLPDALLPPALQAANPWRLARRLDGKMERAS